MIAKVAVAHPGATLREPLDYRVPPEWEGGVRPGAVVRVPFGAREARGVVTAVASVSDLPDGRLRALRAVELGPGIPESLLDLLGWVANDTLSSLAQCVTVAMPPAGATGRVLYVWARAAEQDGGDPAPTRSERDGIVRTLLLAGPKGREELIALGVREGTLRRLVHAGKVRAVREAGLGPEAGPVLGRDGGEDTGPVLVATRKPTTLHALTDEQQAVSRRLTDAVRSRRGEQFLLLGPTGSGKTEVYLEAIGEALRLGFGAVVLVPEISLTPQTARRFREPFGDRVAVLHSALTDTERRAAWDRLGRGDARVAVGPRSAVWAPVTGIGMIVVDEEADDAYVSEHHPHYDARRVARERARREGAVYVAGSATPSLEALWATETGAMERLELTRRPMGRPMPRVEVVDLRRRGVRPEGLLSLPLIAALEEALARGEQGMLLLNRRGYHPSCVCRDCGYAFTCRACDVSLTLHQDRGLLCHYCGRAIPLPPFCPSCRGPHIGGLGTGTQRLEEEVRRRFPAARVMRLDRDAARQRGEVVRRIDAFAAGEADLLIGTQMIAKGHDLPRVTVAAAVLADQGLTFPDHRAAERTAQLLLQVAGRAGRADRPGVVFLQTYDPENPVIEAAREHRYLAFATEEVKRRGELGYPPSGVLGRLIVLGRDEARVAAGGELLATEARALFPADTAVLGPVPPPVARIDDVFRTVVLVRSPRGATAADPDDASAVSADAALRTRVWALLGGVALPPGVRVDVWFEP